jgi:hypothetical protein
MLYCGDIVPDSAVFGFDPPPQSDIVLFDASYGDDTVPASARVRSILEWVAARPRGCLLPTPLSGRSLELLAILPAPIAVDHSMVESLHAQLREAAWLRADATRTIVERLATALIWREGQPLPSCPLLTHDGMGLAGPSRSAIELAHRSDHPILFTGHLPDGSPGHRLRIRGEADWIRMPTHPTFDENLNLLHACRPRFAIGHSCEADMQLRLKAKMGNLLREAHTGDSFEI